MVANDAGDRITPAVVAYRDDEQVQDQTFLCVRGPVLSPFSLSSRPFVFCRSLA